ncbi:CoA transferase [Frankia sp. Ag45/Mut15]|uniref:CoA transferase n=1 Tax=Frankia umida TaxID=573489 RepID=A0ABT0K2D7_9ACTN|nr:CoA transferase [Frankia umida]MCK9877912.1 CoA transferase [Frankia umida]
MSGTGAGPAGDGAGPAMAPGRSVAADSDPFPRGGALRGLRVLDAATLYAGPLIASMLADHGADVVRLEPPGGDPYRTRAPGLFALTGRDKRSIELDLNDAEGRRLLHAMIPQVDVVVTNQPEPRLVRHGLDFATLAALNPTLVLVRFSGYGLDGPLARHPGNGSLGEAFAGLTHMTGHPDGQPMLPSVPLGDVVAAFAGAFGVLAACYQRLVHGGPGQVVDVNPVDAMLHVTAPMFVDYQGGPPAGRRGGAMAHAPLRGVFAAANGQWVAVALSTPRQLAALHAVVDPDAPTVTSGPAGNAPADATPAPRVAAYLRRWCATRSRREVLETLARAGVPVAPVNDAADLVDDQHLASRGALRAVDADDERPHRLPAPAPRLSAGAATHAGRLPGPGEHTADVLVEWSHERRSHP